MFKCIKNLFKAKEVTTVIPRQEWFNERPELLELFIKKLQESDLYQLKPNKGFSQESIYNCIINGMKSDDYLECFIRYELYNTTVNYDDVNLEISFVCRPRSTFFDYKITINDKVATNGYEN